MSKALFPIKIRLLTREGLAALEDGATANTSISSQRWDAQDDDTLFLCYNTKERTLDYQEPKRLLHLAVKKLKFTLGKKGWEKPFVVITQAPDAIGTIGLGEGHVVLLIMWQTVLSDAENVCYFVHEMTEYHLMAAMGDLPRWFWEGMAQIVAYLIVKEIDFQGAASIRQRYLTHGMASQEDYLQWDKIWGAVDPGRHMSADATITSVLAAVEQIHFTPKEKRNYARALEFFRVRIASLAEARSLFQRVQQLGAKTTERLLEVMGSSDEHCR